MRFTATICLFSIFLFSSCSHNEQMQKRQTTLEVACLGDSITSGYKLADPVHKSYPALLTQQSHGQWHVFNLGVNGATVINKGDIPITAQKSYKHLMDSRPDIVVILLGTNDIKNNNWKFVGNFVADYVELIKKIQELPSNPQIIVCSIPPVFIDYPNGLNATRQKQINILIKKITADTGTNFCDIDTVLQKENTLFIDGIHPNVSGAEKIAHLIFQKISALQSK